MKAVNIDWDTNGDKALAEELPKEIRIPDNITDEDAISDFISDMTGFCHRGFSIVK